MLLGNVWDNTPLQFFTSLCFKLHFLNDFKPFSLSDLVAAKFLLWMKWFDKVMKIAAILKVKTLEDVS